MGDDMSVLDLQRLPLLESDGRQAARSGGGLPRVGSALSVATCLFDSPLETTGGTLDRRSAAVGSDLSVALS